MFVCKSQSQHKDVHIWSLLFKGSSDNDGISDIYDRSELKVTCNCFYTNWCYPNCHTNCGNFTWIYLNLPELFLIYPIWPQFTSIYLDLPEVTWIYQCLPHVAWTYLNLPESTIIYLSLPGFTWVYLSLLTLTWT